MYIYKHTHACIYIKKQIERFIYIFLYINMESVVCCNVSKMLKCKSDLFQRDF